MRNHNTDRVGGTFSTFTVAEVWEKGQKIPDFDPKVWRYDDCGKPIKRDEYGNTNSKHGWEIDHIKPVSAGGSDELSNLQPLQWKQNRHKGDNYPHWTCLSQVA